MNNFETLITGILASFLSFLLSDAGKWLQSKSGQISVKSYSIFEISRLNQVLSFV